MRYTWNEKKNSGNLKKHGILFEDAVRIFEGPTLERLDDRFAYGEARMQAIGLADGLELTVIYADKHLENEDENENERRIISAWRSIPRERRAYRNWVAGQGPA